MFYFMSVHSKVILEKKNKKKPHILITYQQDYEQFNNRSYNINIIENICYVAASIKVIPIFRK